MGNKTDRYGNVYDEVDGLYGKTGNVIRLRKIKKVETDP